MWDERKRWKWVLMEMGLNGNGAINSELYQLFVEENITKFMHRYSGGCRCGVAILVQYKCYKLLTINGSV